jgi:hypothetical protein
MKNLLFLIAIVIFSIINIGCASVSHQYPIKEKEYTPLSAPSQTETRVFVFRGTNFAGSAARMLVVDNDTLVGGLDNGGFTSFVTKANRNIIVVASPTSMGSHSYVYFDGRQGKDVYLYFNIEMGGAWTLKEISKKEAQKLISKSQYQELQDTINKKWNVNYLDYYDRLQKQMKH